MQNFSCEFERLWSENQKLRTFPSLETLQAVKLPDQKEFKNFWQLIQALSYYSELYDTNMEISGIEYGLNEGSYKTQVDEADQKFLFYDSAYDSAIKTTILNDFELAPVNDSTNYDDYTTTTGLFFP